MKTRTMKAKLHVQTQLRAGEETTARGLVWTENPWGPVWQKGYFYLPSWEKSANTRADFRMPPPPR